MPKVIEIKGSRVAFPDSMPDHEVALHVQDLSGAPKVDRIRGMADLPLSKQGVEQIKGLSAKLGPFHTISRCG